MPQGQLDRVRTGVLGRRVHTLPCANCAQRFDEQRPENRRDALRHLTIRAGAGTAHEPYPFFADLHVCQIAVAGCGWREPPRTGVLAHGSRPFQPR